MWYDRPMNEETAARRAVEDMDESIRSALDVLTGWSAPRSQTEMIADATAILNAALRRAAGAEGSDVWDKNADQEALCQGKDCGHPYHRHFDWAANYAPGCKYCGCSPFVGGTNVPEDAQGDLK